MSVGTPKDTQSGQRDVFGGKQFASIDYAGASSYNNTGTGSSSGDSITASMFGFFNTILTPWGGGSLDQTGTYFVRWQPVNNGLTAWKLRWFVVSSGAEVTNATNLSAYIVKLAAIGY